MNWRKIILWAVAAVILLIAVSQSPWPCCYSTALHFGSYLLAKVESSIDESTGARVQVKDFDVKLSSLTLDLYSIVVHGSEPAGSPPLLTADHLGVGVTIDSVLGRKWHFRDAVLDHPVAHLLVNRAGENNLPRPPKKSSGSKTDIFDLGIRHLLLDRGEIYYNDHKSLLDADLHDLNLTAGFDSGQKRYQGHIRYDNGHLRYGKYAPLMHRLDARFRVALQRLPWSKRSSLPGSRTLR